MLSLSIISLQALENNHYTNLALLLMWHLLEGRSWLFSLYTYGHYAACIYILVAFMVLLLRAKSTAFRQLTSYGGRTEMSEKEKPKNILEPQPLAEQRKELLGKYSKDRSKKNAGLLRSMIRNGRSCVSDLLHAGVSRKQTFRAYYLTGCIVCVVLWVNSYPSTDWCVVSASQAVQSKLYHQYGKQVAWEDVPDGVEGVVRYAKRLGLSTGETQASAELYQQEMTACHTFARPIGRLGYAGVALFLLHCLIRLLECFLVHRFRPSEEDRVSLLAAVAGITFYVVASFLCFSPPLHAPIIGLQERVFREYGLVRPPGAAEPIPTFTNVLYNVTQKTVFRQNPLYLSLVQPILSGKSASEPIPSAGSLFLPVMTGSIVVGALFALLIMAIQMKCHRDLSNLRKGSRLKGKDARYQKEMVSRAMQVINGRLTDVEDRILQDMDSPSGKEKVEMTSVRSELRKRKQHAEATTPAPLTTEPASLITKNPNFTPLGCDERIWTYSLPRTVPFRLVREPHYLCEVALYVVLFAIQLCVFLVHYFNLSMFETVFEAVYFNPALSSLERYIAMGTAVMPVFALALFTYVNLRMTANEHSKFWKYVNTERRILYTFFSGSSAERGMSARERAEVEQLLQSERAPRSALW